MNRQQRRAAARETSKTPIDAVFHRALAQHQAGSYADAEILYRQILVRKPDHLDSLHLLGAVHSARGDHEGAVSWIGRALALNPSVPEVHINMGVALEGLQRIEEAATHFQRALDLRPGFVDALLNLGLARLRQGASDAAEDLLRQALAQNPDLPEAQNGLGVLLHQRGEIAEAAACFDRAAGLRPAFAVAHRNLGLALNDLARATDAETCFLRALSLTPNDADAIAGLALALQKQGRIVEALAALREGLAVSSSPALQAHFAEIIVQAPQAAITRDLIPLLGRALTEPWARPASLVSAALVALALEREEVQLGFPLMRALLTSAPVANLDWERRLIAARRSFLLGKDDDLPLACALAQQNFLTDYCQPQSSDEEEAVDWLAARVVEGSATTLEIAVVASYRALGTLPQAERLLDGNWPDRLREVLRQQIAEPALERALAADLPALTNIDDSVSQTVRAQYEANPYPRWARAAPPTAAITIDQHVRRQLPNAPYLALGVETGLEILVAGTGTGQQAIETAQRYRAARVLGIDLSRASLAYARRMSRALGLSNIEYAQADILGLGGLAQRFHLIECGGVLHHMADPLAGWRTLVSLLEPRGVMRIALYSELGRKDVRAAQELISDRDPSPAAIRQLRQDLIARRDDPRLAGILASQDFYALSECRDLLLHAREHFLSLPVIAEWINELGLRFLGFECARSLSERYQGRFPQDRSMTDLAGWHLFETEHPDSFIGMYQFWVQKL